LLGLNWGKQQLGEVGHDEVRFLPASNESRKVLKKYGCIDPFLLNLGNINQDCEPELSLARQAARILKTTILVLKIKYATQFIPV
jgi:hypothetical protein